MRHYLLDSGQGGGRRGRNSGGGGRGTSTCLRVYNRRDVEWLYSSGACRQRVVGWRVEGGGRDGIARGERAGERKRERERETAGGDGGRCFVMQHAHYRTVMRPRRGSPVHIFYLALTHTGPKLRAVINETKLLI